MEFERGDIVEVIKMCAWLGQQFKIKRVDAWWIHLEGGSSWKKEHLKLIEKK